MKIVLAFTIFCLCSFSVIAQTSYSIKGVVADTTSKAKLTNTSVSVLNAKDSTLVKFGRAAADGSFSFNLNQGKFILLVAYPEYADFVSRFELDSVNRVHDFKQISLTLKSKLLQEVVINGTAAITIKGDTTVFSTSKLVVQPNANVEDLLKQLPGIQIDQNGAITAQGKAVQKVLVDGEEFFGDDPTLVTKNIRADMVKEFELYDKKSDQAAFTGIDDGVKIKTLNVKLKDDSKNGYFGKVDAGETPNNYYQGQGMFNNFRAKKKMAAYGTIGNTGKTGLGYEDAGKYGAGSSNVQNVEGTLYISGSSDELESFSGRYDGRGIPMARAGGTHYDSKWNNDKQSINVNYKIGSLNVDGTQNTIKQNILPNDVVQTSNAGQNLNNYMFRQKLDATYEVKINATTTFKISADGTLKNTETNNTNLGTYKRSDSTLINSSDRTLSNNVNQQSINANALWSKRLKKAGRTFSVNISESASSSDAKGFLNAKTDIYDGIGAAITSTQLVDQYKTSESTSSLFGTNITWSEPFSKTFSLVLNYGLTLRNDNARRLSYNLSSTGKYDDLDTDFSNNYDLDQTANQFGAIFNYAKKKTVLNFGTRMSAVNFNQTDLDNDVKYKMNYLTWNPQARYTYRFSQQKSLSLGYNGNTVQPSFTQLQPIRVNDDPLNIVLGNADLRPAFRSTLSTYFNSFKVLTSKSIYLNVFLNVTSNPFVASRTTDLLTGITSTKTINANRANANYTLSGGMGWKLKKSGINLGYSLMTDGSNYSDMVNDIRYRSAYKSYSIGASVSGTKLKKYNFYLTAGPKYKTTVSTLNLDDNTWTAFVYSNLTIFLPGKLELTTNVNYSYTESTASFNQINNPVIWGSGISKKFFKKENLKFTLSGNDLLKQQIGFTRNAYQQNTYNTIQRYFMGSITWDFTKKAPVPAAK